MLEIPESKTISRQASETLTGRTITEVVNATSPHKFAFYSGDPTAYGALLIGRTVVSTRGHGMFADICLDGDATITIGDGTNMRYYVPSEPRPAKHQLLLGLDDGSSLAFTVAMYGSICAYRGALDSKYHQRSLGSISPLDDAFDEQLFENIFRSTTKDLSMKALLATEQRIPGLGNGVLQDILFNAGVHPKRKKSTLSDFQKAELFHCLKVTLQNMTDRGGRDTEKDLFGNPGGYKSVLSKNTYSAPCPNCGDTIIKEAYLGGTIYYCPTCQPLLK
ncbi:DNA-formamidopyrimidine glycosylase family protein [uncultured Acetobacteroides sp.]|uniref:DNA-formamidopyrimidine glycosylase family protein n=1 Tax=uncultured Acetobacteroides sp. TaxID=1760811 RepID=UPI0029F4D206|nr:DNA-formamidopyrimidine glycosylase family protein [uncultured Acetobacteroides sp.]